MAILDRFLTVMFEKDAGAVVLESDQQVQLEVNGSRHPVTREPINTGRILTLVREIMPAPLHERLESGDGRLTFDYDLTPHRVDAEVARAGENVIVVLTPGKSRRSSASLSVPAHALLMDATARATVASTLAPMAADRLHRVRATTEEAEEFVHELLRYLVSSESSDLHLRVGLPPMVRTHGELVAIPGHPDLRRDEIGSMLQAIMPERNRQEYETSNDTDFAYEIVDLARFRVNGLADRNGPAAVFRVIPSHILTADQLGLSPEVQRLCYLTKGLVVVTGPTGSGKSTTLAGMVDLMNRTRTDHIITIEDPIEFVHANKRCVVTQRQVGSHTQSFKRALRAALREDPDIILIGEMRDLETVAIAIETAETGHLVFGTLHTTTAVSTVDRIIDQFPADRQGQIRVMLSESLKGVIAQVLCKKIEGGRAPAREILLANDAVSNLIREGKTFQLPSILQTNKRLGMMTLNDSLMNLVEERIISPEEAYVKSVDKSALEAAFKQKEIVMGGST